MDLDRGSSDQRVAGGPAGQGRLAQQEPGRGVPEGDRAAPSARRLPVHGHDSGECGRRALMTRFNPVSGLIIVVVEVWGPAGSRLARLALDTGATASVMDAAILVSIGYDPALASSRTRMTTG